MSPEGNYVLTGNFSRPFELETVRDLMAMPGVVEEGEDGKGLKISRGDISITLRSDGAVEAEGPKPKEVSSLLETLRKLIIKAHTCLHCGICISCCPQGALSFKEGLVLDEEACSHCLSCISPCPVVDYKGRDQ